MSNRGKTRLGWALVFLVCAGLLGYAHYVQFVEFIEPCPLCILQRLGFYGIAVVALAGLIHGPQGRVAWVYAGLGAVPGLYGAGVAIRHVWLQMQPADGVAACGAGLNYMVETLGWSEALTAAFRGTGDCAEIDWAFLGLSMPTWTLICFLGLLAGMIWGAWRWR